MTTLICHLQCCHNITTLGCLTTHTYKPRPGNWLPKGKRGNCWEFPKRKLRWSNKSPVEFIISSYMHFPEKKKNFCPPSENRHELVAFCGLFVYVDAAVIDSIVWVRGRAEDDCSDAARYFFLLFYFVLLYSILLLLTCHRVSVEAVIRASRCSQLTVCHSDTQSDGQAKVDLRMPASSSLLACFDLFPFLLFTCLLTHTHTYILGVSHSLMYCLY